MKLILQPGLIVHLVVNGQRLTEYDDDDDTLKNKVSKYIEAESDANFIVQIVVDSRLHEPDPSDCLDVELWPELDISQLLSWRCAGG